jgi:glycine betaine/proline transport system permease protein
MPAIMAGVNQTIMMALGMVVIAALIGAGGLGREVLVALQRLRVGQALEAGLAIVFMAVILDRISGRMSQAPHRLNPPPPLPPLHRFLVNYVYWATALLAVLIVLAMDAYVGDIHQFPQAWRFSIRQPVDALVRWMRDNLYQVGDLPMGAGPLSDFLTLEVLNPLRYLLQEWLSWPAVILGVGVIAYLSSGWRLALFSATGFFLLGWLGMWNQSMDTLSQVLVAAAMSVLLGAPLGIWAARNDRVELLLRPLLDFLQTIPVFVYLLPVIMLFNIGRVPGLIASVLYAIPPVIRLTNLGIRQAPVNALEAADAFGSTPGQKLFKVQLPLAMPAILLGVNQTVMMVLAMVIIAGLVGGGALGLEAVNGLAKSELGRGLEAGLAIVILAMVLDRVTQAWAQR